MLIEDGKLNFDEFKALVPILEWKRIPRWYGSEREDVFYIAKLENDEKIIEVSVRPSLRMQVSESLKGRRPDGKVPQDGYTGSLVNFGTSTEILVDKTFIDKIKELAILEQKPTSQKFTWE